MNLDDLDDLADGFRAEHAGVAHEVRVCMAASCQSSGAQPVLDALSKACDGGGCRVKGVGCMGLCSAGPLVSVAGRDDGLQDSVLYRDVQAEDAAEIMASVGGAPVERLLCPTDQPFFARQQRVVL